MYDKTNQSYSEWMNEWMFNDTPARKTDTETNK